MNTLLYHAVGHTTTFATLPGMLVILATCTSCSAGPACPTCLKRSACAANALSCSVFGVSPPPACAELVAAVELPG